MAPASRTKNVCNVIGTGNVGIDTCAPIAVRMVKALTHNTLLSDLFFVMVMILSSVILSDTFIDDCIALNFS